MKLQLLRGEVQDIGRFGLARHGVSRTGAADDLALRMGNALLGNAPSAAGLEVTGSRLQCRRGPWLARLM